MSFPVKTIPQLECCLEKVEARVDLIESDGEDLVNGKAITPSSVASTGAVSGTTGTFTTSISIGTLGSSITESSTLEVYFSSGVSLQYYDGAVVQTGLRLNSNGRVGIGTTSPASKLTVVSGDVEVETIASGLILKSPDGTRYRVTAANGGTLSIAAA